MLGECVVCLFVTSGLVLEDKLEVKSLSCPRVWTFYRRKQHPVSNL